MAKTIIDKGEDRGDLPDVLGGYELASLIAEGGSGKVFRARGPDGRWVALKVFDARLESASTMASFEMEASIRIDHPNVVTVHGAGTDEGIPWIALELLEGEPLDARITRMPAMKPEQVIDVGVQVCRGLEVAHAMGIVHRDLKPENLFLCSDGTVKIVDFGIALVDTIPDRLTTKGVIIGTPWYLSPEQARGESGLDARSDIWSLGCVLYEALAARTPFERKGMLATVLAILREELLPLAMFAATVPAPLIMVIERCLVKEPRYRWPTVGDLQRALEEVDLTAPAARMDNWVTRPSIAVGERRLVAVLLAEGATDLERIREAIERQGGTFLPLYGGRAVGLFGTEKWEGDEPRRAVLAALEAETAAKRLAVAAGHATSHGAGISGEALAAAEVGCRTGLTGVAIDPRSARLLGSAFFVEPVSEEVSRIVSKRNTTPLVPGPFAGQSTGPFRDSLSAPAMPPSLYGREAEIAQIEDTLRVVVDEKCARAMLIVGPTGIGKSRLREEMDQRLFEHYPDAVLLLARNDPLARGAAWSVFVSALRRHARVLAAQRGGPPRIDPKRPEAERREAVRALTREAIRDPERFEETAPFIGELLGVPMGDGRADLVAARGDPQLMADRLRMAIRDVMAGLCARGPVVLSVEDLQWTDEASLDLLEELVEYLADAPLLLFATARLHIDEVRPDYLRLQGVVRVEPQPLDLDQAADLATATAQQELPTPLLEAIAARCGGNPLFIEQTVHELRDAGTLHPDRAADLEELPLPMTVEAAIQSRLDHLPSREKELCKRAAVLERPFSSEELEALGVEDARAHLASLRRRGLVSVRAAARVGAGREYRFRFALVGEVAYEMLAADKRSEVHRRAAAMLERSRGIEPEEVAIHYDRGGEPVKAGKSYCKATEAALAHGDVHGIMRTSERALELPIRDSRLYPLHTARAEALSFLGRFAEQSTELEHALEQAVGARKEAKVWSERIGCWWRTQGVDEALSAAEKAMELADLADDADLTAMTLARAANVFAMAGRLDEADAALARADDLGVQVQIRARAFVAGARVVAANARGDLGERQAAGREAVRLHTEAGDLLRAARQESNLADVYNRVGAYEQAATALRRTIDRARRLGNRNTEGYALFNLGYALAHLREMVGASDALAASRAIAARTGSRAIRVWVDVYEAQALLLAGQVEGLAERALTASKCAAEGKMPSRQAQALVILAQAHLHTGDSRAALEASSRAMDVRDRLGGLDEDEADVFLTHATALRANGNEAEALTVLSRGRDRLLALANGIRDPEFREQFLKNVAANRELVAAAGAPPSA